LHKGEKLNINVSISLAPDDETPTVTMAEIIEFFGGTTDKDSCSVNLVASYSPTTVAAPIMPPPPVPNPAQSIGASTKESAA